MRDRSRIIRSVVGASIAGLMGTTAAIATDFTGTATVIVQSGVTITEVAALSFGTVGITNGSQMAATTVVTMTPSDGTLTSNNTSNILIISNGTPLDLSITNGPANNALSFSDVSGTTLIGTGSNSAITLRNFVPSVPPTTDSNGNLSVKFGAELVFLIDSTYSSGTYSGSYTISLNF